MPIDYENDHSDLSAYAPLYGGKGEIRYKDFFRATSRLPVRFQVWTVPVGGSEGEHSHAGAENLEEVYYILDGRAEIRCGGQTMDLGPGDAARFGPREPHELVNSGDRPLRLIVIYGKATGPHIPA